MLCYALLCVFECKMDVFSSQLTTKVFNRETDEQTDLPLPITIIVDDVNDNAPTFKEPLQFNVLEQCSAGEEHEIHTCNPAVFDLQCG